MESPEGPDGGGCPGGGGGGQEAGWLGGVDGLTQAFRTIFVGDAREDVDGIWSISIETNENF